MKKFLPLFTVLMLTVAVIMGAVPCSAKTIHTKTLSFIDIRANAEGPGYKWNNYNDILTLDGLNIDTEDEFGLKINDGATVIIKGNNHIKASKAAVFIEGKVIIKGSGTLTLVSETGIFCSSDDSTDTLTINDGKFNITASSIGIVSDFHTVNLNGVNMKINAENGTAIKAQKLKVGVKTVLYANAPIIGEQKLYIDGASLTVNTASEALKGNSISIAKINIKAGDSSNTLSAIDTYDGQACIKTTSTYDDSPKSVILGEKFGAYFDTLIFIGIIAVLSAVVVLPIVIKKKKAQAAIEARDKAEEERKAIAKAKKKSAKRDQ